MADLQRPLLVFIFLLTEQLAQTHMLTKIYTSALTEQPISPLAQPVQMIRAHGHP